MGNPATYQPGYYFSGFQASNPAEPLPADEVDNELANIEHAINNHAKAINDVRRSDGHPVNRSVSYDTLDDDLRERLTAADEALAARDAILAYVPAPYSFEMPGAGAGPYELGYPIGSKDALRVFVSGRKVPKSKFAISGSTFSLQNMLYYPTAEDTVDGDFNAIRILSQAAYMSVTTQFDISEVGNQTPQFAALNQEVGDTEVDLEGKVYLVDAVPPGRYRNGAFRIASTGLCVPMRDFFIYKAGAIPRDDQFNIYLQGNGYSWRDRLGLMWAKGPSNTDLKVYGSYTANGGLDWTVPTKEIDSDISGTAVNQPGVQFVWNGRMVVISKGDGTDDYKMFSKVVPRYEVQQCTVSTTVGQYTVVIGNTMAVPFSDHGILPPGRGLAADTVAITKFIDTTGAETIGGLAYADVNGNKTPTYVSSGSFSIEADIQATSTATKTMSVGVKFLDKAFEEHIFSGQTWDDMIIATGLVGDVVIVQGAVTMANRDILIPISGDYKGIARSPNPQTSPVFEARARFVRASGAQGGVLTEPTIARDNDDMIFGFLRTQNPLTEHANFWHSYDRGQTIAVQTPISAAIAAISPIPCQMGDDGKIYGFATERLTAGTGIRQQLNIYMLVADKDEAFDIGGPAFDIHVIGEVDALAFNGNSLTQSSPATSTGRGTTVKHGSWIYYFYEEEEPSDLSRTPAVEIYANIKYIAVNTDPTRKMYPLTKRGAFGG